MDMLQEIRYSTEIVIREKDVNQNICFTLNITANSVSFRKLIL